MMKLLALSIFFACYCIFATTTSALVITNDQQLEDEEFPAYLLNLPIVQGNDVGVQYFMGNFTCGPNGCDSTSSITFTPPRGGSQDETKHFFPTTIRFTIYDLSTLQSVLKSNEISLEIKKDSNSVLWDVKDEFNDQTFAMGTTLGIRGEIHFSLPSTLISHKDEYTTTFTYDMGYDTFLFIQAKAKTQFSTSLLPSTNHKELLTALWMEKSYSPNGVLFNVHNIIPPPAVPVDWNEDIIAIRIQLFGDDLTWHHSDSYNWEKSSLDGQVLIVRFPFPQTQITQRTLSTIIETPLVLRDPSLDPRKVQIQLHVAVILQSEVDNISNLNYNFQYGDIHQFTHQIWDFRTTLGIAGEPSLNGDLFTITPQLKVLTTNLIKPTFENQITIRTDPLLDGVAFQSNNLSFGLVEFKDATQSTTSPLALQFEKYPITTCKSSDSASDINQCAQIELSNINFKSTREVQTLQLVSSFRMKFVEKDVVQSQDFVVYIEFRPKPQEHPNFVFTYKLIVPQPTTQRGASQIGIIQYTAHDPADKTMQTRYPFAIGFKNILQDTNILNITLHRHIQGVSFVGDFSTCRTREAIWNEKDDTFVAKPNAKAYKLRFAPNINYDDDGGDDTAKITTVSVGLSQEFNAKKTYILQCYSAGIETTTEENAKIENMLLVNFGFEKVEQLDLHQNLKKLIQMSTNTNNNDNSAWFGVNAIELDPQPTNFPAPTNDDDDDDDDDNGKKKKGWLTSGILALLLIVIGFGSAAVLYFLITLVSDSSPNHSRKDVYIKMDDNHNNSEKYQTL